MLFALQRMGGTESKMGGWEAKKRGRKLKEVKNTVKMRVESAVHEMLLEGFDLCVLVVLISKFAPRKDAPESQVLKKGECKGEMKAR
jgi:hypothetical protein